MNAHSTETRQAFSLTPTMDFSNLWKPCYRFPHACFHKVSSLKWLAAIGSHCLDSRCIACLHAKCLRSAVTCGKTPATVTLSEPLKIFAVFCYAIKTNTAIRSRVSQLASAGKGSDMSELQADHGMTLEQWTWLLCSVSVILANKLSLQELHQLIGIKLLTFAFLEIFSP